MNGFNLNGTVGVLLTPDRFQDLLNKEHQLSALTPAPKQPLNTIEQEVNRVDGPKDEPKFFEYEGKKYAFISDATINVGSILHKFAAHPSLAPLVAAIPPEVKETISTRWLPVVAYKDLESNAIEIRMREEFYASFKNLNP